MTRHTPQADSGMARHDGRRPSMETKFRDRGPCWVLFVWGTGHRGSDLSQDFKAHPCEYLGETGRRNHTEHFLILQ